METLPAEDARRLRLTGGVVATEVLPDSPADRVGLRLDDIIREINRKPVRSVSEFERRVTARSSRSCVLLILRDRATLFLSLQPE